MLHENKFWEHLKKRPMQDDSRESYVQYIAAVEWGIGEQITPALLRSRTDADILEQVRQKDKQKHPGEKPADDYVRNMKSALRRYREMCEANGL